MTERVLITGIKGFAGHYMASELLTAGYEVWGLSNTPDDNPRILTVDLRDAAAVRLAVAKMNPSRVVHLAAISFVAHDNVADIYNTNVVGTRNLLMALTAMGTPPTAVLLVSSANVYGNSGLRVLSEGAPVNPANDYAVSKIAMEYMARQYADRLNLIIARPFNYTGNGQSINFLVPKIVSHFRRRAPVIELGNLDVARDFSDVRDVVAAFRLLIESPEAAGSTFNICSGVAVSLMEILEICGQLTGFMPEVRVNPAFVRANEVKLLVGSGDKLARITKTIQAHTMKDTLAWMLEAT